MTIELSEEMKPVIRKIIIGVVAAVVVLAGSSPTFALTNGVLEETTRGAVKQVESTAKTVVNEATGTTTNVSEKILSQKEQVEARRAELKEKLTQKMADRKVKLEGRRLAQCENRQKRINELLDTSVSNGRTHLENIQRVEAKVSEFYTKKALSSTEYDTALQNANTAEASAIAVLDVLDGETFDCQSVDGAKPNEAIQTARQSKKTALHDYRQAVIELIHVTKQAFAAQQEGASDVQN